MKTILQAFFLILILLNTSKTNIVPLPPTDTSAATLDIITGSSRPMTVGLDNGNYLTIYQVTIAGISTIYYTQNTSALGNKIISNTWQTVPWVVSVPGSNAAVLYQTYTNGAVNVILHIFTLTPPVVLTVTSFTNASFTDLYPNAVRNGNNITVCWSQVLSAFCVIYTNVSGTWTPGNIVGLGVSCTQACYAVIVPTAGGKYAITTKFIATPYTTKVTFLNAALANDTTINSGASIAITFIPNQSGMPAVASGNGGSEVLVAVPTATLIYVMIYNASTGVIISSGPCSFFAYGATNLSVIETSIAGLYALAYTSISKAYTLLVDNSCTVNILPTGTNNIQIDNMSGVTEDFTSVASIAKSSTLFFISYVQTNTDIIPNDVRIKARMFKLTSDCSDINIYISGSSAVDPFTLGGVYSVKIFLYSTPNGILTSGSNLATAPSIVARSSLTYVTNNLSTDSLNYKISKFDNLCKATFIMCTSACATCIGPAISTNMNCLTCIANNYITEGSGSCYPSVAIVPGYIFSGNMFKACYKSCKSCIAPGGYDYEHRCIICNDGYVNVIDNNTLCYKPTDTPNLYFYDIKTNKFNYCYSTCLTCKTYGTIDNHNCLTCGTGKAAKIDVISNCYDITTEVPGYKYDSTRNLFVKCYSSCKTCTDNGTDNLHNCIKCLDGYYSTIDNPNNCYNKDLTVSMYYFDSLSTNFKKCYISCSFCNGMGNITTHNCNGCLDIKGYYPIGKDLSMCYQVSEITDGYYFDNNSNSFQPCYKTCNTCKAAGTILNPNCLTCKDGLNCGPCTGVIYNDSCINACPENTYLDLTKMTCVDCLPINDPHCCSTYFYKNQCIATCPEGTLVDSTGKSCYACFELNKFVYKGACIDQCPRGAIKVDSICKNCSEYDQYFYNNSCVNECPASLIPINGVCDKGITSESNCLINIVSICPDGYCLNSGTCTIIVNKPICTCSMFFTGINCQINKTDDKQILSLKGIYKF
jgi:hypothetical protein